MVGPLLRSICSSTQRSYSSSSSSSFYCSINPLKSSLLHRISRLTRHFSAAPVSSAAEIADVDHGKTTLMDRLLRQCGADFTHEQVLGFDDSLCETSMSNLYERSITISSKVISIPWGEYEMNMIDTPGHTDFNGEVKRVVGMVEGALLVVDGGEGPLAQTKFALAKALKYGLRPLLLLNKVDYLPIVHLCTDTPSETCDEVKSLVFGLFSNLGASEEQLDFLVRYTSAKEGWTSSAFTKSPTEISKNMAELLDAIVKHVPSPTTDLEAPFQMLALYSSYTALAKYVHPMVHRFERWLSRHGRHYKDKNEWNLRFGLYQSNVQYIDYVNSQNGSLRLEENDFADMSCADYNATLNFHEGS